MSKNNKLPEEAKNIQNKIDELTAIGEPVPSYHLAQEIFQYWIDNKDTFGKGQTLIELSELIDENKVLCYATAKPYYQPLLDAKDKEIEELKVKNNNLRRSNNTYPF